MSIDAHPRRKPLVPSLGPAWGMTVDEGSRAPCLRFVLSDRIVTFAADQMIRWDHHLGEPETLSLTIAGETVCIEGAELVPIRDALDQGRLLELRLTPAHESAARPGPRIHRITIEPTTKHGEEIPFRRSPRLSRRPSSSATSRREGGLAKLRCPQITAVPVTRPNSAMR